MSLRRSARPEANEQLVAAFTYVEMGDLELMMLHAAAAADVLANKYPDLGEAIELTRLLARSFAVWSDDADRTAMLNYELRISNGSHLETRLAGELHQVRTEVAVRDRCSRWSRTTRNESGTSTSSLGSPGVPL